MSTLDEIRERNSPGKLLDHAEGGSDARELLARLDKAIEYMEHREFCDSWAGDHTTGIPPCNCGLEAAKQETLR